MIDWKTAKIEEEKEDMEKQKTAVQQLASKSLTITKNFLDFVQRKCLTAWKS